MWLKQDRRLMTKKTIGGNKRTRREDADGSLPLGKKVELHSGF